MTLTDWIVAAVAVIALLISINTYYDGKRTADATVVSANAAKGSKIAAENAVLEAKRSADAAEASVVEARRSGDAAERSAETAETERRRAIERSDVAWAIDNAGGDVSIKNVGITTAFAVTAIVRVGGERFDLDGQDVASDEMVTVDADHVFQAKRRSDAATVQSFRASGIFYAPSGNLPIEVRVSWQSELGTPFVESISS